MDFETLAREARDEGVTQEENLPFLLTPDRPARSAVLLVHGFTASPWEMRPLARQLVAQGLTSLAVRLPGHGVSAEKLARSRLEDWLAEVERGVQWLRETHQCCYGVGLSTGGLLLLPAAAERRLDGLALLSPYLRLRHWLAPLAGLLQHLVSFQDRPLAAGEADYYTSRRPVAGIHQLNRLVRRIRPLLPRVRVPTLVLSSSGDRTVRPESALDLFNRLGTVNKSFHLYGDRVPHVLTSPANPLREEAVQRVGSFLLSLDRPSGSPKAP